MKITGIHSDPSKTNEKQVAYITDPPLSEEVFAGYAQMFGASNFFIQKDGLLITKRHHLNGDYLDETETFLTQVEQQITRAKDRTKQTHESLLQRISEQSGRPISKTSAD